MSEYNNYQIPQQFAGNLNTAQTNGGYPYGYPPITSQSIGYGVSGLVNNQQNPFTSPFQQPQPMPNMSMPVPGVTAPLELSDNRGNTVVVPPSSGYNQGGATISQGGFNPVTKTVSQPVIGQGFNPYTKFIGNPGYNIQGYEQQPQYQQGFSPYYPQPCNPYYSQQYYGYGQNEFNSELQKYLYEQEPSCVDTKEMLEQVILTKEEQEKVNHNRVYITGVDYYGKPIYNNGNYAYQMSQQRQEEFEQARHAWQTHFTMLSKIAHAYYGEQIDENSAMRFFDPVPPQPIVNNQKIIDYSKATDEEKKEYNRNLRLQKTAEIDQMIQRAKMYEMQLNAQKEAAFTQIKASHDRLIGVEPGQHYDLKTYMDNGYKLGVNIAMKQAKSSNRNGTNKYSRNEYRANLSQVNNTPVPIESKNDEYITIENSLKAVYDRNRKSMGILRDPNSGQLSYTGIPAFSSELESHKYFLQAMQDKKDKDDVRRAVL